MSRSPGSSPPPPKASAAPALETADSAAATPKYPAPAEPTSGESWWKAGTYFFAGYGANLLFSVAVWDYFLSGHGRPVFDKAVRGLSSLGVDPHQAETITKMACSPLGGHLITLGIYPLEKWAPHLTHWLNCKFDSNYQYKNVQVTASTPRDQVPAMVKPPADPVPWQMGARRGLAWATVTAAGTLTHKLGWDAPLENWTLNLANKGIENSGSRALEQLATKPIFQRYTKLAALDVYFTVITSGVVYATNTLFGKKEEPAPKPAAPAAKPGTVVLAHQVQRSEPAHLAPQAG